MASAATRTVGKALAERVAGDGPGRFRSLTASVVAGFAAAALTYKLLRSGS